MLDNREKEILRSLVPKCCKMVDGRLKGGFRDWESEEGKVVNKVLLAIENIEKAVKQLEQQAEQDIYERAYKEGQDKGLSDGRFVGYNKAIDDFVTRYKHCDSRGMQCKKALNCADCIAEQLKEGGTVNDKTGNRKMSFDKKI